MPAHTAPRPSLAAPDDDPWLWLEEIDGEAALAWVNAQNAATLARLADARFEADRAAVKALLDRPDKLAQVTRRGRHLYNFWQDAAQPRGIWRRTSLESYRGPTPDWEILLDLDALAATEGEDWIWFGAITLPGTHARAMLHLSPGGGDAVVLREFDLETRSFVPDGFVLPAAKGGMVWLDQDRLLLSSAHGEGMATRAGYARCVRLWQRGEAPGQARVIFAGDDADMAIWGDVDREVPGRLVFFRKPSFFATDTHLGDLSGPRHRLDLPGDAEARWSRGWLIVRPRSPWLGHAADTLLAIRLDAFLAGGRAFTVLSMPAPRRALSGFFWCDGRLVVAGLDELRPVFIILTPTPEGWSQASLPGLPQIGVAHLWSLDMEEEESDGTLLIQREDPLQPPALLLTSTQLATPALLKQASPAFDAQGLVVTRHEAISVDGERIPYVQTGPAGLTGEAPVHLGGYGGFRISRLPGYQGVIGKLWLEKGGTSVVANIRGGGEFGTRWHEAALREKRHLAHDDFAAVAADLVRRGVTRPGRIAAEGGSNGGLLIANMLTRYPERFGALFCTVPLIDMRRFPQLLAGASWIAEYGDPAVPQDWEFIQHFSAYHVAEPGRTYPPILLATRRRDDRVHPGHARKMAAKLQAMGYPALFHEPGAGGHGVATDNGEAASFAALGAAFLRRAIGWEAPLA
ncbi:prolyl oligopeptidase family serine peptidase [Sediminicoccus sp. KRV36]|uniref:prolyl oligopeptidase family serine peptidase n=1 Tax=Sediminicoccus sp. KRV36 TaxID=3133721 RepID=UPI00200E6119|nr:prolyl oligopeptidase family serine peptidase [Sediminicoccus rosea]UPY37984.1 prolyl oligopeptidase family serine peptidase [Sediminicoccus rosea]